MHRRTYNIFMILMLVPAILAVGCGPNPKDLYETAELEVLQNSREHAAKLFRRIIEKHPRSEYAVKAKQRLEELGLDNPETGRIP